MRKFLVYQPSIAKAKPRQLHSENIDLLEHFGRKLYDASDILNVFKKQG